MLGAAFGASIHWYLAKERENAIRESQRETDTEFGTARGGKVGPAGKTYSVDRVRAVLRDGRTWDQLPESDRNMMNAVLSGEQWNQYYGNKSGSAGTGASAGAGASPPTSNGDLGPGPTATATGSSTPTTGSGSNSYSAATDLLKAYQSSLNSKSEPSEDPAKTRWDDYRYQRGLNNQNTWLGIKDKQVTTAYEMSKAGQSQRFESGMSRQTHRQNMESKRFDYLADMARQKLDNANAGQKRAFEFNASTKMSDQSHKQEMEKARFAFNAGRQDTAYQFNLGQRAATLEDERSRKQSVFYHNLDKKRRGEENTEYIDMSRKMMGMTRVNRSFDKAEDFDYDQKRIDDQRSSAMSAYRNL